MMSGMAFRLVKGWFMVLLLLGLMLFRVPSVAAAGDINGDGEINLPDAILALKICAKMPPGSPVMKEADVNGDGKIGIEEVIYLFQRISALRSVLLRVSAPNGGEALTAGSAYTITWQGSSDIQKVDILLSVDSGVTYPYTLVEGTPNNGRFTWAPVPFHDPAKLSAACRIQVRDSANPATVFGASGGLFSLNAAPTAMTLGILYDINTRLKAGIDTYGLQKDTDGDGLHDNVELYLGTNPRHPDSDKDGVGDRYEVFVSQWRRGDPVPDENKDGLIAALDTDDDGNREHDGWKTDTDGDGIPDYLEMYGFVYDRYNPHLFEPWGGDITTTYYKTDPYQLSSDRDQYDDKMEITRINMDDTVKPPGDNPMIAALPNFRVRMTGYTVTLKTEITETDGTVHGSSESWEERVDESTSRTNEEHWDLSTKVSAGYGLTDMGVSVEVGYSYGQSTSQTKMTSTGRSQGAQLSQENQWSRATATNTTEAAEISVAFETSNVGTCNATQVTPTVNLLIGDRLVATRTQPFSIGVLEAGGSVRWSSYTTTAHKFTLTLDELRALQTGAPVTIEVADVSASVGDKQWKDYFLQATATSARLFMDLGDGKTTEHLVYAGNLDGFPKVTLRDALVWAAKGHSSPEGMPMVKFYQPGGSLGEAKSLAGWYFSLDAATREGIADSIQNPNFNFFDTVIHPGGVIVAKAPPAGPNPQIHWAELSPQKGTVRAYVEDYFFTNPAPRLKVYFVDKYGREHEMTWNHPDHPGNFYFCACPESGDGKPYVKDGTERIVARNSLVDTRDPQRRPYENQMPISDEHFSSAPSFGHPSWLDAPLYNVRDVFVRDNYAYLANGEDGLLIVNADPASPDYLATVGSYRVPAIANLDRVFVSGSYAYMTDQYGQFYVVNVADPAHPAVAGSCSLGGGWFSRAREIFVSGGLAYVANGDSGLVIVNVADPAHPAVAGSYDTPGAAGGVFVSGGYAYVADGSNGLVIVNVADPAHPGPDVTFDTPGTANGVFVSGGYAYVADGSEGLAIVNLANPAVPTPAGKHKTTGQAFRVIVSGNLAYIADGVNGLVIVDVTDPAHPAPVGTSGTVFDAERLFVSGDYAYLNGGEFGTRKLQVIGINPANPDYLRSGAYNTPGTASCVVVSGNYAYVADGGSGLQIIDVADPLHPVHAGAVPTSGTANGVFVSGSYAYVADGSAGLTTVNVTNPMSPYRVATVPTSGTANGVFVSGSYVYVADGSNGLVIVNVTNPANPVPAGFCAAGSTTCDMPGYALGIRVSNGYAYVATGSDGVQVIDVADPEHPRNVGSSGSGLYVQGVFVSGEYVYMSASSGNSGGVLHVITFR